MAQPEGRPAVPSRCFVLGIRIARERRPSRHFIFQRPAKLGDQSLPSIYVESGIEEGSCFGFPPGDVVFIVGRAPNCGIVITDPLVSRQHCRIERVAGRYKAVDLGSHNGVSVNEEKLGKNASCELSFGDVIRVGESELLLREEGPDDEGELAGRRLGGYQLVKRIGSGGMGEVYRAVQIALGRPVAIKILSPELTEDRTFVERFMTEAQAAGKLNHPNVAQVHEVGDSDGIYYYSMEYLPGGSVQDKVRGGRNLPVEEAAKVVLQAARALDYAEKQGIIHCDIKPDNLMLTEDGEVRLTDLGIARTVASRTDKVKQEGGVLGSPHYMAPEQARGEPIDHRVDIYALGATFYRLLSGRTPFTGKSAREIMEKQVYEDPPGLRSLDPSIPQAVCLIINTMMKKRPDKRYQTAREAIVDLEHFLEDIAGPTEPERTSRRSRVSRRGRQKSGAGRTVAIVVAMLVVIGGAAALMRAGTRPGVDVGELLTQAEKAEARDDLTGALNLARRARDAAKADTPLFKRADEIIKRIEARREELRSEKVMLDAWNELEEKAKKTTSPAGLQKLAGDYEKFAAHYAKSRLPGKDDLAAKARLAATHCLAQYATAAEAEVDKLLGRQAQMVADCKFGDLRRRWEDMASRFKGLPAGKRASEFARASETLPMEEMEAAKAAAQKALDELRLDEVTKPLERFRKADIGQLVALAETHIEEFAGRVKTVREEQSRQGDREKKRAACRAIAEEAAKLARAYDYVGARQKFSEARIAYRREGFPEDAGDLDELSEEYLAERALFDRLAAFNADGGLKFATVLLADKTSPRVVSVSARELTYTKGMGEDKRVAWKDLPASSVYNLLKRPRHAIEERLVLVRFALHRGMFAEAKAELDKILVAEPDREKALTPLRTAIDQGLAGGGAKKDD